MDWIKLIGGFLCGTIPVGIHQALINITSLVVPREYKPYVYGGGAVTTGAVAYYSGDSAFKQIDDFYSGAFAGLTFVEAIYTLANILVAIGIIPPQHMEDFIYRARQTLGI